jgi:hypothetical protein
MLRLQGLLGKENLMLLALKWEVALPPSRHIKAGLSEGVSFLYPTHDTNSEN